MEDRLPLHIENALAELERNIGFYCSYFMNRPLVAPDIVQITLTYRCNLKCKMCSIRGIKASSELEHKKVLELIDEAAAWGVPEVLLLGGEPFLEKALMEYIEYAHGRGVKTTVVTNGTLIGKGMAKQIARSHLGQLVVSLDGARERTHDSLRQVKGAYQKALRAIQLVNAYKKKDGKNIFDPPLVIIPATLMNGNLDEMWEYVCLGRSLGVAAVGFQPVAVNNADLRFSDTDHPMWIPQSRLDLLDSMVDRIREYKKDRKEHEPTIGNTFVHLEAIKKYFRSSLSQEYIKCYMGYTRVVISPDGDTSLCGKGIGNVNTRTMRELWDSEAAMRERISIRNCQKPCLQFCTIRPESEPGEAFDSFAKKAGMPDCCGDTLVRIKERLKQAFSGIEGLIASKGGGLAHAEALLDEMRRFKQRVTERHDALH